jgi:hypothetical protein
MQGVKELVSPKLTSTAGVVIMDHHVNPKETLLHLPALVPARSTYWLTSASLSKSGLSGGSPAEKAKAMARA